MDQNILSPEEGLQPCHMDHGTPEALEALRRRLPSETHRKQLAELFRIFGDPTRIHILLALDATDMCVCHLAQLLGVTVSAVSHQLRLLKAAGLVTSRRDGKSVIYSLADHHVRTVIENGTEHILE